MYARSCVSVYPNTSRKKACVSTKKDGDTAQHVNKKRKNERKKKKACTLSICQIQSSPSAAPRTHFPTGKRGTPSGVSS